MLAAYENAIGEWPSFSIWKGDKAILNEEIDEVTTIEIYKKGNQCYLGIHGGYTDSGWWMYGTIQNAKWTYIFDGSVSEEWLDFEGNDYIVYYEINGKDVTQAEYDKVRTEYENFIATASYQFCLINGAGGIGPLTPGNVRPQLEETVIKQEETAKLEAIKNAAPEEILAQIAYIGDRSKCKMDTQMAQAYADVLRGLNSEYGKDLAVLIDFAQTGYPFLLTTVRYRDDGFAMYDYGSSILWGYNDGRAKKFTFEREPGVGNEYPEAYHNLTDIFIGTTNRGPRVMARAYEGETGDSIHSYRMYEAKKSDLVLVDNCIDIRVNEAETFLNRYDWREEQDIGQDISGWAEDQVALAVREGVASRGSVLLPQNHITREQAAVVLYRLFLLLYEVRPVALEVPQATSAAGGFGAAAAAVAVAAVAAGGAGAGVVLARKRKVAGGKK